MNPPKAFNSIPEALLYFLLLILIVMNIIGLKISSDNAAQAKMIAAQNQRFAKDSQTQTLEARKQNIQRLKFTNDHIDCLILYSYDHPEFAVARPTKEQTQQAIKDCTVKAE